MLSVRGLSVRYGGSVLGAEHVTFDVPVGSSVALMGANGAGKTTILRAIGGLLSFHRGQVVRGSIEFEGHSILPMTAEQRVRAGIAQSLEGRRVFGDLTVKDNLQLGAFAARDKPCALKDVLDLFPRLGARMSQVSATLSGGEQQMLAIGRALMARPKLLILDEPSLGLAPKIVDEIADAITQVVAGDTSVLLVDQSTRLAMRSAQHAYLVETGRTVADGPAQTFLADAEVRSSYLGTRQDQQLPAAAEDVSR